MLVGVLLVAAGCASVPEPELRLYTVDCGSIAVDDMAPFADDGSLDGESVDLANPCFLVRHGARWLLWDTGHPDSLAGTAGIAGGGFHSTRTGRLVDQLRRLDLTPESIDYLALSHHHPDHAGNANLFRQSTWIVSRAEHEHMFSPATRENREFFDRYSDLEHSPALIFDREHDVFGDGSATIFTMPGHTPGSSVLLLRLAESGALFLTGDLYTHERALESNSVPRFTMNREELLASRRRFKNLAAREKARIVVQHAKPHFESLPRFPEFLD
ncbi:hypothetical protein ABI59_08920 [Acidobacteria bacterium Mor1]|nr:hypothetical protein ABI59_08920 [Acidobacteria bacterium Mor1]